MAENSSEAAPDAAALARLSETFAGVVGHDLRNPLNVMLTSAHVVLQRATDADTMTALKRIIASGHRMQRMIDQLLDLTRLRTGGGIPLRVGEADFAALATACVEDVRSTVTDCSIALEWTGTTSGHWDSDRIAQLLTNIIGNAAQHGIRERGVRVAIDGSRADEVVLTVHNAGAIAPDLAAVLFSPFRIVNQTREKSRALGLGLYLSREIARAHSGHITVDSSVESGTTVRVRLPRQPPAGVPSTPAAPDPADLEVLERLAATPPETSVTAQLFGAAALHERAPQEYWRLFEQYCRLLDVALDRQTYARVNHSLSEDLREIAGQLGRLGAGAREVAELHARALRQKTRGMAAIRAQALTTEGRLVSFELMGHLVSFYRRRSGLAAGDA